MKNNSHFRNKSEKLTYIGYGFLLLCVFLTSYVPKTWAKDGFMNLQSTYYGHENEVSKELRGRKGLK